MFINKNWKLYLLKDGWIIVLAFVISMLGLPFYSWQFWFALAAIVIAVEVSFWARRKFTESSEEPKKLPEFNPEEYELGTLWHD